MTTLTFPSFHDGQLTSVSVGDKQATIGFRRYDGGQFELHLAGVEAFQIEDFREGNTVLKLDVITGREPDLVGIEALMGRLFRLPHAKAAANFHEAHSAFVMSRMANIASGKATLVVVTPSYGADLVAFCAAATLSEVE